MGSATPRIFVSIASYCDPILPWTLDNCLAMAIHPEALRFGICWQFDAAHPVDLARFRQDPRFRFSEHDYRESRGGSWARNLSQTLWDGEEYVLQIDSHMAFGRGWDDELIRMAKDFPAEKPLISMIAPLFWHDDEGRLHRQMQDRAVSSRIAQWEASSGWSPWFVPGIPTAKIPSRSRFLSGQFVFTLGEWTEEVRQDPEHYYWGEEFALTVRSFTCGYDLFLPDHMVVWHMLHRHGPPRRHWENGRDVVEARNRIAFRRLHQLVYSGADESGELGRYGLCHARSLRDYEVFAGIDLAAKTAHPDAFTGRVPDPVTIKSDADWSSCVTVEDWNAQGGGKTGS